MKQADETETMTVVWLMAEINEWLTVVGVVVVVVGVVVVVVGVVVVVVGVVVVVVVVGVVVVDVCNHIITPMSELFVQLSSSGPIKRTPGELDFCL